MKEYTSLYYLQFFEENDNYKGMDREYMRDQYEDYVSKGAFPTFEEWIDYLKSVNKY